MDCGIRRKTCQTLKELIEIFLISSQRKLNLIETDDDGKGLLKKIFSDFLHFSKDTVLLIQRTTIYWKIQQK